MSEPEDTVARTWDGEPISPEPPTGAMIVVYRRDSGQPTFLLLHRKMFGPDFVGDWAWGPPSGARYPGEDIDACAARELMEETGLSLSLIQVCGDAANWYVYLAETDYTEPRLSNEHDRFDWLPYDEAASRIAPEIVRTEFASAVSQLAQLSQCNCRTSRISRDT